MLKKRATLRLAKPDDASAITDCVNQAYKHYIDRLGKPPGPMLDDYTKVIELHHVHVAEVDRQIAGALVLIRKDTHMLIDNIAVKPEFQRQGLGSALLDLAETVSRSAGYSSIQLYTHELMIENIEMYKRKGYTESEQRLEKGYRRVYMQKAL